MVFLDNSGSCFDVKKLIVISILENYLVFLFLDIKNSCYFFFFLYICRMIVFCNNFVVLNILY